MADQSSKRGIDVIKHEDTELRLGLPGASSQSSLISASFTGATATNKSKKRAFYETSAEESTSGSSTTNNNNVDEVPPPPPPPPKAQIMGWPPIRSYRKNCFQAAAAAAKQKAESTEGGTGNGTMRYIKVSVDGAPYLRKIDLKLYKGYTELLKALEDIMFKFKAAGECGERREGWYLNGSEFVATYEDRDGDWMLVGDVPWEMFSITCKRLRIMKGSIRC